MNPFGGKGKAKEAAQQADKLLKMCHVEFELVET